MGGRRVGEIYQVMGHGPTARARARRYHHFRGKMSEPAAAAAAAAAAAEEPPPKKVKVGGNDEDKAAEETEHDDIDEGKDDDGDDDQDTPADEKVILGFFKKVSDMFGDDEYEYSGYIEDKIDDHPDLLEVKCPGGVNDDWEGMTLLECLCSSTDQPRPDVRDLMYDLVCQGAIATDKCYSLVFGMGWGYINMDLMLVLVLSSYIPLKFRGSFMLDEMIEGCEEPDLIDEILRVLLGKVKANDSLGCGKITEEMVKDFKNLPKLEVGVTHKEGGEFAKYLEKYQKK